MTRKEYDTWAKAYVAKFGINDTPGLEMVLAWYDDLESRGATIADLIHVASRINPQKREQHRGALVGGVIYLLVERRRSVEWDRRRKEAEQAAPPEVISKMLRDHGCIGNKRKRQTV